VRALYERAGFEPEGHTEVVFLARVDELPRQSPAPFPGLELRRAVGTSGTRLSALLGDELAGYVEVETLDDGGRLPRHGGFADVANLHVAEKHRRRGLGTWLVGQAAEWLELARVERLLDYARVEEEDCRAFLARVGFRELTRTERGWRRVSGR
jgi:ribosomal protein S18 acetylase RimI-like enzyme